MTKKWFAPPPEKNAKPCLSLKKAFKQAAALQKKNEDGYVIIIETRFVDLTAILSQNVLISY